MKNRIMKRLGFLSVVISAVLLTLHHTGVAAVAKTPEWSMQATIIEACSCPMFCQCYFNTQPAGHHHEGMAGMEERFCRFNNAFKVNKGRYGNVKLDGAKFWVAGDLGSEFSGGQMDWAVLTFDPSVAKEQRDAIAQIMGHVYPVKWHSFTVGPDAPVDWQATTEHAEAALGGGKVAEIALKRNPTALGGQPTVIKHLKYWGAPRNDGFVLMPSAIEAYRVGDKPFEFKETNGFMITFDIASRDVRSH